MRALVPYLDYIFYMAIALGIACLMLWRLVRRGKK